MRRKARDMAGQHANKVFDEEPETDNISDADEPRQRQRPSTENNTCPQARSSNADNVAPYPDRPQGANALKVKKTITKARILLLMSTWVTEALYMVAKFVLWVLLVLLLRYLEEDARVLVSAIEDCWTGGGRYSCSTVRTILFPRAKRIDNYQISFKLANPTPATATALIEVGFPILLHSIGFVLLGLCIVAIILNLLSSFRDLLVDISDAMDQVLPDPVLPDQHLPGHPYYQPSDLTPTNC